jgi:pyrroline-5-carboxylate reductase
MDNYNLNSLVDNIATPHGVTRAGLEIIDSGYQKDFFNTIIQNGFQKIDSINDLFNHQQRLKVANY